MESDILYRIDDAQILQIDDILQRQATHQQPPNRRGRIRKEESSQLDHEAKRKTKESSWSKTKFEIATLQLSWPQTANQRSKLDRKK